ncbi:hypothetical protein [Sinomonas humi]|uniref:Polysaccharide chain length determinant N-terminal domain-containing protein n=1 Tax=Sinomonas humi TaxID=1338436 RepID=A0A0B2AC94_9MICC|nr:hypothetical protein [Sinomonas humi]KHL01230.1 hypothetical protein LK10_17625 [Sinomonas humi]
MKLRTLGAAIIRRWYALVSGLLVVGGLSYFLYGLIPVDYKVSGSAVLLPSEQSVGAGGNPYLFLSGLGQAMDVLTRKMTAPDVTSRLTADFPRTTYTAAPDVTSGSSILVVTVKSSSSAQATAALAAVLNDVPVELSAMQDELKVPSNSRISSMQVAQPDAPIVDGKPRIQAVAAVGVAGLLVAVLFTALLDGILLRRAAGRVRSRDSREDKSEAKLEAASDDEQGNSREADPVLVGIGLSNNRGNDGESLRRDENSPSRRRSANDRS